MGRIFKEARFVQMQWRVWSGALMCILLWAPPARLMEKNCSATDMHKKERCKSGRTLSDRKSVFVARFAQMEEQILAKYSAFMDLRISAGNCVWICGSSGALISRRFVLLFMLCCCFFEKNRAHVVRKMNGEMLLFCLVFWCARRA